MIGKSRQIMKPLTYLAYSRPLPRVYSCFYAVAGALSLPFPTARWSGHIPTLRLDHSPVKLGKLPVLNKLPKTIIFSYTIYN